MAEVARVFGENTGPNILHHLDAMPKSGGDVQLPWKHVREGEMPPMMFQLRMRDGRMISYCYNDLREVHCPDAGRVQVYLQSISKWLITFHGRRLRELAELISCGMIRSISEADPRSLDRPESLPDIVEITIEPLSS